MSELGEYWQLPDVRLDGVFFVDMSVINLDDLLNAARPGAIVRCKHLPAIQYVPNVFSYDHIAGLISDAA